MIVEDFPTFTAGATLAPHTRVKLSTGTLVAAGLTDQDIGTVRDRVLAIGDKVSVTPWAPGKVVRFIAADSITQYATIYTAASGRVSDSDGGSAKKIGIAMTAADAAGTWVDVLIQSAPIS